MVMDKSVHICLGKGGFWHFPRSAQLAKLFYDGESLRWTRVYDDGFFSSLRFRQRV